MSLRRSQRNKDSSPKSYREPYYTSYPEGEPATLLERQLAALNQESFSSQELAAVDDLLVYSLFATKRRHASYRALRTPFLSQTPRNISRDEGVFISEQYHELLGKTTGGVPELQIIQESARTIQTRLPHLFQESDVNVLAQ